MRPNSPARIWHENLKMEVSQNQLTDAFQKDIINKECCANIPTKERSTPAMKRFLTILLTTLALTAALCVSASASTFDSVAEDLSRIGMLKGSANGFNLDQVPTRGQAAIMLVRLFGAEDRAQKTFASGRITCPFTDVNETTAPYVAWLADEGLANGTSETTFGAADPCTAKAYTIFLLRALGYQDRTDFTTGTAQDFAASLGIIDTSALTGTFLRDDLAALTYQALGTDLKDGSTYLLDSLIKEGIIDSNAAYPITSKIEVTRVLNTATASLSTGMAATFNMDMSLTTSTIPAGSTQPSGRIEQNKISGKGDIKLILGRDPQMALDMTVDTNGQSETAQMWLEDNWMYVKSGEETFKTKLPDEYQDMISSGMAKNSGTSSLPFIETVQKSGSGSDQVYKLTFNDSFGSMINSILAAALKEAGLPEEFGNEISIEEISVTYTVRSGVLKKASVDMLMSVGMTLDSGARTNIGMVMGMNMDISATGKAVKITFPDFSDYEEIIGGANGSTGIKAAA